MKNIFFRRWLVALCFVAACIVVPNVEAQIITTVAGTGTGSFGGDNGPATNANLNRPYQVALDGSGNLYIADYFNHRIRKVVIATGIITTVAGNGIQGFGGDNGPATNANLDSPSGVTLDGNGNLYIADYFNHRIRKVVIATGIITTVAGNGIQGFGGDNGPATNARLYTPSGVFVDGSGNLYIADLSNDRIRKVTVATGIITTVAGNGTNGFGGDNGLATNANLKNPYQVALDRSGNLYIADLFNNRIRKVTVATGIITTVAGSGTQGFGGDNGPATNANLFYPSGVFVDGSDNLYIADHFNNRIRKVTVATGIITTVAGNGTGGFGGDNGPATNANLNKPYQVVLDGNGNLYIADAFNNRIRKVSTPPPLTITGFAASPTTVCTGKAISFTATVGNVTGSYNYTLTNGSSTINGTSSSKAFNQTLVASGSGPQTFTLTLTSNGQTAIATTSLTVNALPTNPSLASNGTITCAQTSVTLTASATGGSSYTLTNGTTGQTNTTGEFVVSTAGAYTAIIANASGCTATAMAIVGSNEVPPLASLHSSGMLTCATTSVTLTANTVSATDGSYRFSAGATQIGTTNQATVSSSGTYSVTVIDNGNGCAGVTSVSVSQDNTPPVATISASPSTTLSCSRPSLTLTAGGGSSYRFAGPGVVSQNGNQAVVNTGGLYSVTVTASNGCSSTTSVTVDQDTTTPSVSISPNSGTLTCNNPSLTLTANPNASPMGRLAAPVAVSDLRWNTGATTNSISVTTAGTYSVTFTAPNGCTATSSVVIEQNTTPPMASLASSGTLTCSQTSVTLTAGGGSSYAFSGPGVVSQSGNQAVVNASGTYSVTVTATNGCTSTTSITIDQDNAAPAASLASSGTLTCATTSVTLTANAGTGLSYQFSPGATQIGSSNQATVSSSGTYSVTVTAINGCTSTTNITIEQDITAPTASLTNNGPLSCATTSVTLTAGPKGQSYQFSPEATQINGGNTASVSTPGIYSVTVVSANGCSSVASTTVAQDITAPTASLTNNGPLSCTTTSVTLTAMGGTSYTLSNGQTSTTGQFTVSTAGTYTVTVSGANGCTATATTEVFSNTTAPANASLTSGTLTCAITSVTLTASATGGTSYTLSDGQTNSTGQFVVSTAGGYTVTVSNANGCTATATTTVQSNTTAPAKASLSSGTLTCSQTSVTLTASAAGGTSYTLSDGQSNSSGEFVVNTPGGYTVVISGTNGCTASATSTVESNTVAPMATLTASSLTACAPATGTPAGITLTAGGGTSYTFSAGATQIGTSNQAIVTQSGTYSVTVSNASGCTATASVSVTVNTPPAAPTLTGVSRTVNASTTPLPLSQFVQATGSNTLSFSGVNGPLNPPNADISQAGVQSFSVSQTSAGGCVSPVTPFTITVVATPGSQTMCRSSSVVLKATTVGVRYEWYKNGTSTPFKLTEIASIQKGTTTSSLTLVSIQTTATYYVKVFQANGSFSFEGPFQVVVNYGCIAPGGRVAAAEVVEVPLSVVLTPNPVVDGQLRAVVSGAAGMALSVELVDLKGQLVRQQQWTVGEDDQLVEWNISQYPAGMYVLRAESNGRMKTVKVIHR